MESGLMGLRPSMPVPWRREIFSSSVISLRTRSARSSAERAGFIQGCVDFDLAAFEDDWAGAGKAKANRTRTRARPLMLRRRDVMVSEIVMGLSFSFDEIYLARPMIPAFAGRGGFQKVYRRVGGGLGII